MDLQIAQIGKYTILSLFLTYGMMKMSNGGKQKVEFQKKSRKWLSLVHDMYLMQYEGPGMSSEGSRSDWASGEGTPGVPPPFRMPVFWGFKQVVSVLDKSQI